MRNRAKCKLCKSIIESKHRHDYVTCSCGEISIDGGNDYLHCHIATDPANLICVDDEGNEIIPKKADATVLNDIEEALPKEISEDVNMGSRRELLSMIDAMIHNIDSMPNQGRFAPVTHSDFAELLSLVAALFRSS